MSWLCRVFGHKIVKRKGDHVYYTEDASLCFRCGPLKRTAER